MMQFFLTFCACSRISLKINFMLMCTLRLKLPWKGMQKWCLDLDGATAVFPLPVGQDSGEVPVLVPARSAGGAEVQVKKVLMKKKAWYFITRKNHFILVCTLMLKLPWKGMQKWCLDLDGATTVCFPAAGRSGLRGSPRLRLVPARSAGGEGVQVKEVLRKKKKLESGYFLTKKSIF